MNNKILVFLASACCVGALAACSSSSGGSGGQTAIDLNSISGGATATLNAVTSISGAIKPSAAFTILPRANESFESCSDLVTGPRVAPGPLDASGNMLTPGDDDYFALGMIACKISGGEYSPEGVVGALVIAKAVMSCGVDKINLSSASYQDVTIPINSTCFTNQDAADFMSEDMGVDEISAKIKPTALSGQAYNYKIEIDMDEGSGFDGNPEQVMFVKTGSIFAMKSAEGWQVVLDTVNGRLMYDFNDTSDNKRRLRFLVEGTINSQGQVTSVDQAGGIYFEGQDGGGDYGLQGSPYHVDGREIFTVRGSSDTGYATYHAKFTNDTTLDGASINKCIEASGCEALAIIPENEEYNDYKAMLDNNLAWTTYLSDTTKILDFSASDFPTVLNGTNYENVPPTSAP